MTGLSPFQPGGELYCPACALQLSGKDGEPACQVALELACEGEPMTVACCPQEERRAA